MADSELLFASQVYDCLCCGKSCGGWRILVEPPAVDFLSQLPLTQERRARGYIPLQLHSDGWAHVNFDERGKCTFLGPDLLCEVHRGWGFDKKPRTCQQFPFFFTNTPDGLQVGLSFCCTAVQQNHGRPLEDHRASLQRLADSGHYPEVGPLPLRLNGPVLSWADYRLREAALLSTVRGSAGCQQLQEELWRAVAAIFRPADVDGFALFCREGLEGALWASLVGYLEAHDPESMHWVRQCCLEGTSFVSPRFGVGISAALLQQPSWLPFDHLGRYLEHLLERKFLALGPSLAARLVALALLPRLLGHYVKVLGLALGLEPLPAYWKALDMVEGEVFAHVSGLEGLFEAFESTTSSAAGQ